MVIDCQKKPVHGGHIQYADKRKDQSWHIIGLCARHNHPTRIEPYEVDERTWWAPAEYIPGNCGIISDLEPGDLIIRSQTSKTIFELIELVEWEEIDVARWLVENTETEKRMKVRLNGQLVRYAQRWTR